jgi:hypothetical protein
MHLLPILLLANAEAGRRPPSGAEVAVEGTEMAAAPVTGTPAQEGMVRALSARDAAPPCAEVEKLSPTPVADLRWLVHNVSNPPWVGIRAAECLITGHAAEVPADLESWVTAPELLGLGLLVFAHVDKLPPAQALHLAQLGLTGPNPRLVKLRLAKSTRPEIQALAQP